MTQAFLTLLDMSLAASYVILFVFLLRWIWRLINIPRRFSYLLWAFVLIRLLVPTIPESELSRLPGEFSESHTAQWSQPAEKSPEQQMLDRLEYTTVQQENPNLPIGNIDSLLEPTTESVFSRLTPALTHVWLTGMGVMLGYNLLSLLRLRRKLADSIPLEEGVHLSDHIDTAFVMGLLRPRIYLPAHLTETEQRFILAHERYHIRRHDHQLKLLASLALTLHWFNPLVWPAFSAGIQDMELSCDEVVTGDMDSNTRADYAQTLLTLTAGHRPFAIAPVAFGEGDVSRRIRHVFSYRKPALWLTALLLVLVALLIPGLLTNPAQKTGSFGASVYNVDAEGFTYEDPNLQSYYDGPFMLTTQGQFMRFHDTAGWIACGYAAPYELSSEEMAYMMRYRHAFDHPVPVTRILDSRLAVYKEDSNGIHMFFLLTFHEDGQRYISYGSCLNDQYNYKDMFIHKVFDVEPDLSEYSNNGPFYSHCISQYTNTNATTYATHHIGSGVQIVAYTANEVDGTAIGWMTFRITDGIAEDLHVGHHFASDDNTGGVYFSHLRPEAEGVEYDVILVNNPLINSASVAPDENNNEVYHLDAPDILVIPRTKGEQTVHFHTADGVFFAPDGTVISAISTPELVTSHQLVRIEGSLYYNTGIECDLEGNEQAGTIASTVPEGQIPTENNQSNFGTGYNYRWHMEPYYVEVGIDGTIYRFKQIVPPNDPDIQLDGSFDGKTLTLYCSRSNATTQSIAAPDSFTLIDMDSGAILSHVPIDTYAFVEPGKTYTWTADLSHLSHLLVSGNYRAEMAFWFPDGDGQRFYAWHDFVWEDGT